MRAALRLRRCEEQSTHELFTDTHTTMKHARTLASLVAAGALLAVPATGIAAKPATKGKPTPSRRSARR